MQVLGLMQEIPLTTNIILARGERLFGDRSITTRVQGSPKRVTIRDIARDARRLVTALDQLDISADARVATFAWNTAQHLALYFAIPGSGRVMHTANIRYSPEQLIHTFNDAEDEAVFIDRSLLPAFSKLRDKLPMLKHIIVMDDGTDIIEVPADPRIIRFKDLLETSHEADLSGRIQCELTAAAICYTSGTTGNPKGVVYSHRSTWLHSNSILGAAVFALTDADCVLPVVPMFHANAWGLPYAAFMAGARLVMPGADLTPTGLLDLMESERVTVAAGVPTIWLGMTPLLEQRDLRHLRMVVCGGSAVPQSLSEAWRAKTGVPITQAWGMTEMSPLGTVCTLRSEYAELSDAEKAEVRARAGIAVPGVEVRIVDSESGEDLPWDDKSVGELQCRGPWVARQYLKTEHPGEQFTDDGWLRTGDVAAISPLGYIRLVDRTKDLVKSGGEWISSVEIENEVMSHPQVKEAAVIAVPHPKWGERPLACVVVQPGESLTREQLLEYLRTRLDAWRIPDEIVFVNEIPKTSVGKFSKKVLRDQFTHNLLSRDLEVTGQSRNPGRR